MSYTITIQGHAGTAEEEAEVAAGARAFCATLTQVSRASFQGAHGTVDLLAPVPEAEAQASTDSADPKPRRPRN